MNSFDRAWGHSSKSRFGPVRYASDTPRLARGRGLGGHVGCCDSSPGQHATAHYRGTGHSVVQSYECGLQQAGVGPSTRRIWERYRSHQNYRALTASRCTGLPLSRWFPLNCSLLRPNHGRQRLLCPNAADPPGRDPPRSLELRRSSGLVSLLGTTRRSVSHQAVAFG